MSFMKVEIKTDDKGFCKYFKIDGKEYGNGIYELNIKIKHFELPEILIKAKSNEFILDSEDNKLFLEKINNEE